MKYIVLLFTLFVFVSCVHQQSDKAISIDGESTSSIKMEELFKIEEVIPLETSESSLIGRVGMMIVKKDRFFVLDDRKQSLLVFEDSGKFLFKIGKNGRGPGEYITPLAFDVTEEEVVVFDNRGYILCYDFNGGFIKTIKTKLLSIDNIKKLHNGNYLVIADKSLPPHDIYVIDDKGEIIQKELRYDPLKDTSFRLKNGLISTKDNGFLAYSQFTDVIYEYKDNRFERKYEINFSPKTEAKYCNHKLFRDSMFDINIIISVLQASNSLVFYYWCGKEKRLAVYDINKNTTRNGIIADLSYYRYTVPIYSDNDYLYGRVSSATLKKPASDQLIIPGKSDLAPELEEVAKQLSIDDNPIVVKYSLKDDED